MIRARQRLLFMVVMLSMLGACAAPQGGARDSAQTKSKYREYTKDFLDEFSRAKLHKNGEYLFCDQPGYLDCFKSSRGQCLRELSALKEDCFKRTEQKFPDRLTTEAEIDEFAGYFSICMMIRHAASSPRSDMTELSTCLKNVQWDNAQRDRSFLR